MREPSSTLRLMLGIAVIPVVADGAILWHGRLAMLESLLALYHTITQFCQHAVRPSVIEVAAGLAASGLALGTLVVVRGARELVRRYRETNHRVGRLLDASVTAWPPALQTTAAMLGLTEDVVLVEAAAPIAYCYGFARPRIVVSTGLVTLLTPVELAAVLLHEAYHRQHQEPRRVLVVAVVAQALAIIPTLGELRLRYEVAKEFAADAAAVRIQGDVAPLAGALYKVLCCQRPGPDLEAAAVGGLSVTEQSLDQLLAPAEQPLPPLSASRVIASAAVLVATVLPVLPIAAVNVQPLLDTCRHF